MTTALTEAATPALQKLLQANEQQLYEQLGIRSRAIELDPSKAGSFDPEVTYEAAHMGLKEDVAELGRALFQRWNAEAYAMVCGSSDAAKRDRTSLLAAFGASDVVVAATLSGLLVAQAGLSPAVAAVIAALVIRRFFRPGYEEFCKVWKSHVFTETDGGAAASAEPA